MTARRASAASGGASAGREAVTLPFIFLTATLAGGFRAAAGSGAMRFVPPPLISLVLATLLIGVMVRARLLAPQRLMNADRGGLANLSGAVVLATLFAASAQLFTLVTPEAGILNLLFNLFFFLLLWNTLTTGPDAPHLMRSLLVVFGSAFVMKYIVLAALYEPQSGFIKRLVTAMLEGVTLGTMAYEPFAPITGYIAFFTIVLYMIGLALLPRPRRVRRALPEDEALMVLEQGRRELVRSQVDE